ncbi:MAG: hypothetical protein A2X97_04335 [Bdellovibrionales bacterium GWA1_52_35]|nr:MAG: hypothetical protein A2X97_04335 [Bdellovibrionales bacterium GWA1_52_35]
MFTKLAHIAHVLGSPARLRIIQLLAQAPRNVEELARLGGESVANTSQHLQKMSQERLVYSTRHGLTRVYQLSSPAVLAIWESLQEFGHTLSPELVDCEQRLYDPSYRSPLSAEQIFAAVQAKKAVLLDIRDSKETSATPISGALSIPLDNLKDSLDKIKQQAAKNSPVYVVCRGRYCELATEAVEELRAAGYEAFRVLESPYKLRTLLIKK